jgi:hypothetical protein
MALFRVYQGWSGMEVIALVDAPVIWVDVSKLGKVKEIVTVVGDLPSQAIVVIQEFCDRFPTLRSVNRYQ